MFSLWAAKSAKIPVRIAHSHSTTNKVEKKKNLIKQILRPFSKVFATDYMCCSEYAGRWLFGNKEYNNGNVYLLNNAIDLNKFKYDENIRNIKRKELNIDESTFVIGHVGRFVKQKNHRFLIDIFYAVHKQNPNTILLLVGQGPLMAEIKEQVKNLELEKYVIFLGQRNDVNELYQAFDIFCLPSLYEGLGMSAVEALISNLPCVVSNKVPKEVAITDNVDFIETRQKETEWKNKIINKANSKLTRKSYIEEATQRGYNIECEKKKLEEYYLKKARS